MFTHNKIDENLIRILCPGYVFAYLVLGEKEAILIDTGYGLGSIKEYVRSLTTLPIRVILTHFHFDHSGGCTEFDEVFLSKEDIPYVEGDLTLERRGWFLEHFFGLDAKELIPPLPEKSFTPLNGGERFDLGNEVLEILPLPGHSLGSVAILFEKRRALLLGDSCNSYCLLTFKTSTSIEKYKESLTNLWKEKDRFDTVFFSHPGNYGKNNLILEMVELCEEILSGKVIGNHQPMEEEEGYFLLAIPRDNKGRRVDGKTANLVYNPEKIR